MSFLDNKHSNSYSNRLFGFGSRDKQSSGIKLPLIKPYFGECNAATKDGLNCSKSLVYTADGKILDCSEYCFNNCDKWVNEMFLEKNIPTSFSVLIESKTYNVGIRNISITIGNSDTSVLLECDIIRKGKRHEIICDESKDIKDIGNIFCEIIKSNTSNLFIEISISLSDHSIFNKDEFPKFLNFKNNIKIFRSSKYWELNESGLSLKILLN